MNRRITRGLISWFIATVVAATFATGTLAAPSRQAPATVQAASNPTLGTILVNSQGFTLYYNTAEHGTTFVCTGACLGHWPALALPAGTSAPSAGPGITGTLGVVARPDGTQQVTYNGEPLYTFAGDSAAGQTNGEGIKALGGVWHAAQVNNTPSTVLAAAPAVPLSVRITRTGATTWGTVTVRYRFGGRTTTTTCSAGSCRLAVPGGVQVHLSEAATDAHTWPFAGWVVRTGSRTRTPGSATIALHLNRATKITARYIAVR